MSEVVTSYTKKLFRYFLQGLFVLAPIAITIYILWRSLYFVDTWMDNFMETYIPGLGTAIIVVGVTFLGYITSTFIAKPVLGLLENVIAHIPFVNIIYKSIKDLFSAIFGNNSTFKQPVLVTLNKDLRIQKIGFITKKDLSEFGIKDKIAVYFPHSYNISGNLYIVPLDCVEPLHANGAELMKFVVSGGMSGFKQENNN